MTRTPRRRRLGERNGRSMIPHVAEGVRVGINWAIAPKEFTLFSNFSVYLVGALG